jgi:hypothetical protein
VVQNFGLSDNKGRYVEMNRRDFMALSAAAAATLPSPIGAQGTDVPSVLWHQKIRRVGQTNMTEHDPAVLNVEEWADY